MRLKVIAILGAIAMTTAASAQVLNEELSGEAVLSGDATQRLEEIGRRAAEAGLVLQVNAPDLWEAEILTPVRRGAGDANLEIKFVNTMSETVVIRGVKAGESEDPLETLKRITNNAKARSLEPQQQESEPAPAASREPPQTASSRPDIERPATDVPDMKVERPRANLPRADARESSRRARQGQETAAKAPEPSAAPTPPPGPEVAATAKDESSASEAKGGPATPESADERAAAEEKEQFERLYNGGRTIRRDLAPDELRADDLVFKGNHHDVVVRRGISTKAFWLEGEPPAGRLEHQERNRYVVVRGAPESRSAEPERNEPPGKASERERFERIYNQGRRIRETIEPAALRRGDELYVGDSVTVVLRRSRLNIDAFWLARPVSLDQSAIEHEQKNKYVVVGNVD